MHEIFFLSCILGVKSAKTPQRFVFYVTANLHVFIQHACNKFSIVKPFHIELRDGSVAVSLAQNKLKERTTKNLFLKIICTILFEMLLGSGPFKNLLEAGNPS